MPERCCVKRCRAVRTGPKINGKKIILYGFPKNPTDRARWLAIVDHQNKHSTRVTKYTKICSLHFVPADVYNCRLKPAAVPTVFPRVTKSESIIRRSLTSAAGTTADEPMGEEYLEEDIPDLGYMGQLDEILVDGGDGGPRRSPGSDEAPPAEEAMVEEYLDESENDPELMADLGYMNDFDEHLHVGRRDAPIRARPEDRYTRESVKKLEDALKAKTLKVHSLQQKLYRRDRTNRTLSALLGHLKSKTLLTDNAHRHLAEYSDDLFERIRCADKVSGRYPAQVRSFAITLHFYSPRAYDFVRQMHANHLPHPRTLRKWYQSVDGQPGCTTESLAALRMRATAAGAAGKRLVCNLVLDEMSIRRQVVYNAAARKYYGFCDLGAGGPADTTTTTTDDAAGAGAAASVAREALVFLVNAVNDHFKIPVAYFFVSGLSAGEKGNLLREVLVFLSAAAIDICSITFDGAPSNIAMARQLGASFDCAGDLRPSFEHPATKERVAVFWDVCHMVKLVRNTLATHRTLYDAQGRSIRWGHFEKLERLQSGVGVLLGNRMRKQHIEFEGQKMKTSLAVQTFSHSVAAAMRYLMEAGHADFADCAGTIEFILVVNNLFDILNSKSKFGSYYKRPFNAETEAAYKQYFRGAAAYLKGLYFVHKKKSDQQVVVLSKIKTGYVGFIVAMQSIEDLHTDYVRTKRLDYLLGFKFSQDHLETFFSAVRGRGGWNNNPNCVQFTAAYKRLLVHNEIRGSRNANCTDAASAPHILSVSSSAIMGDVTAKTHSCLDSLRWPAVPDDELPAISPLVKDTIAYIAGFVERSLHKRVRCRTCAQCIRGLATCADGDAALIKCKDYGGGGLTTPKEDILEMCRIADSQIAVLMKSDAAASDPTIHHRILGNCFGRIRAHIFDGFFDVGNPDHLLNCPYNREFLIEHCLGMYIKIKLYHIGTGITAGKKGKPIRQKLNKLVLFRGQ